MSNTTINENNFDDFIELTHNVKDIFETIATMLGESINTTLIIAENFIKNNITQGFIKDVNEIGGKLLDSSIAALRDKDSKLNINDLFTKNFNMVKEKVCAQKTSKTYQPYRVYYFIGTWFLLGAIFKSVMRTYVLYKEKHSRWLQLSILLWDTFFFILCISLDSIDFL